MILVSLVPCSEGKKGGREAMIEAGGVMWQTKVIGRKGKKALSSDKAGSYSQWQRGRKRGRGGKEIQKKRISVKQKKKNG